MSNLNLQKLREWVWPWPWTFNAQPCQSTERSAKKAHFTNTTVTCKA